MKTTYNYLSLKLPLLSIEETLFKKGNCIIEIATAISEETRSASENILLIIEDTSLATLELIPKHERHVSEVVTA